MCAKIIPGKLKNLWGTPGWEKVQCSHLALVSDGYLTLWRNGPNKPIISYLVCVNDQGSWTPWPGSGTHCLTQVPSCLLIFLFTSFGLVPDQIYSLNHLCSLLLLHFRSGPSFAFTFLFLQLHSQVSTPAVAAPAARFPHQYGSLFVYIFLHRLFLSPLLRALELWILPQSLLLVFIHVCDCISAYTHILHVCVM